MLSRRRIHHFISWPWFLSLSVRTAPPPPGVLWGAELANMDKEPLMMTAKCVYRVIAIFPQENVRIVTN